MCSSDLEGRAARDGIGMERGEARERRVDRPDDSREQQTMGYFSTVHPLDWLITTGLAAVD